jgi:hypothetical protein
MTYILQPGDPQARPPYLGENILMHGGFLACNHGKLSALCDLVLNGVDPDVQFSVVSGHVLYAALYAERMRSADPRDARFGSVPEIDIGLWVLTWGGRRGHLPWLRWMPAFIFVDSSSAMMTGRELYGYPKQFARMVRTGAADDDFGVQLHAIGFEHMDPAEQGREHQVLSVARDDAGAGPSLSPGAGGLKALAQPFLATVTGEDADSHRGEALGSLVPPFLGMPMVFLRQMRDVASVDGVQVQEISAATVEPTAIHGVGLAPAHTLNLSPLASVPIAETLGCAASAGLDWTFWAKFDFRVGPGRRL